MAIWNRLHLRSRMVEGVRRQGGWERLCYFECVCMWRRGRGGYCHTNGQFYWRQKHTRAKTGSASMRSASKKNTNFFVLLFFSFFRTSKGSLACDKYQHSSQEKHICNTRAPRCLFLIGIDSLHMLPARHVKNICLFVCILGVFWKNAAAVLKTHSTGN